MKRILGGIGLIVLSAGLNVLRLAYFGSAPIFNSPIETVIDLHAAALFITGWLMIFLPRART